MDGRRRLSASLLRSMPHSPGQPRRSLFFATAVGTQRGPFGWVEWLLLGGVAIIWGSSYLLIAIGLESLDPAAITWVRVVLGSAVLVGLPAARRPIERADWGRVAVLGIVWSTIPFLLGPISQQHISSAMAGMINSLVPICSAVIAVILLRSRPRLRVVAGILLGFVGAIGLTLPAGEDSPARDWGILLALIAVVFYGWAFNLAVPLQQKYGSPAVIMRSLGVAAAATAPFGVAGLAGSDWSTGPVVAVVVLGVLNTGVAFALVTLLVGRVGPTRGSVAVYFLPIVAMVLGVLLRDETVLPIQVFGTGLVLIGAFLASRGES